MAKTPDPEGMAYFSLSLYWVMAERCRNTFLAELHKNPSGAEWSADVNAFWLLWYASLNTVVDGWVILKLEDPTIDAMLRGPYKRKLTVARNKVMHFMPTYPPKEVEELIADPGHIQWVNRLTDEFGRVIAALLSNTAIAQQKPPSGPV